MKNPFRLEPFPVAKDINHITDEERQAVLDWHWKRDVRCFKISAVVIVASSLALFGVTNFNYKKLAAASTACDVYNQEQTESGPKVLVSYKDGTTERLNQFGCKGRFFPITYWNWTKNGRGHAVEIEVTRRISRWEAYLNPDFRTDKHYPGYIN